MRRWLVTMLFLSVPATFFLVAALRADDGKDKVTATPLMREVTPSTAKAGDTVTIFGEHLDKGHVAELYLTAGELTVQVEVLTQEAGKITFVTPKAEPGRLRLMVLTKTAQPRLIEQPVTLEIQ